MAESYDALASELAELRRTMFQMGQGMGEMRGDIKLVVAEQQRMSARIEAYQAGNEKAHARQDTRVTNLGIEFAEKQGAETAKRRFGSGFLVLLAGMFGAVATFVAQFVANLFHLGK